MSRWKLMSGLVGLICVLFMGAALGAEFSADVEQNISMQGGQNMKMSGKIYVKGKKMRREFTATGNAMPIGIMGTVIIDMETGKMIMLQPEQKMYIEMPMAGQNMAQWTDSDEDYEKIGAKRTLQGSEKISGYKCEKYLVTFKNEMMGKTTQWYSKKLECPIKVVTESSMGSMTMELKNIKKGKIKDSLFKPPADYTKMEMPNFGGVGATPQPPSK